MNMDDMLLQVMNANKHFGVVHVLKNVDFDIKVGEVHCLVGPNGCGKSTLIKIISGVYQPDPGTSIIFEGKHVAKMTSSNSMDKRIQVIYQDLSVFPNLTVAENISFFLNIEKKRGGVNWDKIKTLASDTLKKMKVNLPLVELVENLSIAERQLIAIARALATNAKLIIMDEPTSSLRRAEILVMFDVIRELKAANISVIFVSHKLNEIIEVADRVTVVRDGEKIGTFSKDAVDYNKLAREVLGLKEPETEQAAEPEAEPDTAPAEPAASTAAGTSAAPAGSNGDVLKADEPTSRPPAGEPVPET
jgi:simple sugar transport system ATP-binding protein